MKKFIVIAILVSALMALLAGTALAAGQVTPPMQGYGPGGMRASGAAPAPDCTANMAVGMAAGGQRMMMGRGGASAWAGEPEEVATLLGMTAEEIQAERQAGKSLEQIAADKGVSEEKLVDTIVAAHKADLAALVADGKLTQAQADLMLEHMQAQVKTMVERTSVGPMFGRTEGAQSGAQTRPGMGQGSRGGRWANR